MARHVAPRPGPSQGPGRAPARSGSSPAGPTTSLDPRDPALGAEHLLAVPAGVTPADVAVLVASRFQASRWEDDAEPAVLRLSRFTTMTGPLAVAAATAESLGLPAGTAHAYLVRVPPERGEPPWPGSADPDGLSRAFPDALPVREEARVLELLVGICRRVHGALRVAGTGLVLRPDPEALVDLLVCTDVWLEPEAALAVVRQVLGQAELALGEAWDGPPPDVPAADGPGALDEATRRALHAAADEADAAALAAPVLTGFGIVADLGAHGLVAVEAGWGEEVPASLHGLAWARDGVVAHRVRWTPVDVEALHLEHPDVAFRALRREVAPVVAAVAGALQRAVGGEVADAAGFLVHPEDL